MKSDPAIIKRIMPNLPINQLSSHMVKVFKKFTDIYKEEYCLETLDHLKEDPRELSDDELKSRHKWYFECIL